MFGLVWRFLTSSSPYLTSLVFSTAFIVLCGVVLITQERTPLFGQTKVCLSCFFNMVMWEGEEPTFGDSSFVCLFLVKNFALGEFTNFLGEKILNCPA